jgi:hypothetical protein
MRDAPWRETPATPAQVTLVSKRWSSLHPDMDEEKRTTMLNTLTKGKAADIITRLKHGCQVNLPLTIMNNILLTQSSKGRLKKKIKEAEKQAKKAKLQISKELSRRAREEVKVGLLQ